ncbi:MAG: hypothetical protein JWN27_352 [Candidatus Eremiobacteraeota bacterium]|nr:hypothetical protein [Candidatus Eremiobacteraeota bacterium]
MLVTGSGETMEQVSYPCSFSQERLLRADALRPGDPAANASLRWKIRGDLKQATLEQSWQLLVARHEILRTRFELRGGTCRQIVEPDAALHIAVVDCSVLDKASIGDEIARIAAAEARRPFDLSKAPLIRITRVVTDSTTSVLLVSAHQMVCDGWSFGILAREMGEICDALQGARRPRLPELFSTFGTFARWQRGALTDETLAEELTLLREDFRRAVPFALSTDRPRQEQWSSNVQTCSRVLDSADAQRFVDDARVQGATPFMAMLAAAVVVLAERSRAATVTLTTQVACRDEVDIENVVGAFVNTIPLQVDVSRGQGLVKLLAQVGDVVANAIELRHVPFDCVAETLFGPVRQGHGAPCDVNFVYQKAFTADAAYTSFTIESEHSRPGGTSCDLNLYVVERPKSWRASCDYNPDIFNQATIESLLDRFEQVISRGVDSREVALFFHSDLFASGYYADEIAAAISEYRIVPVDPHGIGNLPMLPTIDAMADDYVARLDQLQPRGPYRLIGFCSGAQVAFEVARRLKEKNEVVEQVILINATAPVNSIIPFRDQIIRAVAFNAKFSIGLRETICYNVARLNRALLRGPLATAQFIGRMMRALLLRRKVGSELQPGESYVRKKGDLRSEVSIGHIASVLAHRPHHFPGDVTLIWSTDQASLTNEESQGWRRLVEHVSVVPMSGGHVAPLHSLVGELSRILQETLNKSSREETDARGA